jgi:nucleoside-diphosphate-sugar epimerase
LKVLLTGANGFVGSHVLDSLRTRGIPTTLLLRPSCDKGFIQEHLGTVEVLGGSITKPDSLRPAMEGVTHVIHCAGLTRARNEAEFLSVNRDGTRNVVEAANAQQGIQRIVHVSSLAAAGPAAATCPAREQDPARPVSQYGRSKLAGETELRERCRTDFVVIRPPAVYGPRDKAFLSLFKAVQNHLLPQPSARQALSLVYVKDLAEVIVNCLLLPAAAKATYFVAAPEITSGRALAREIAEQIGHWTIPCPTPPAVFLPLCLLNEAWSRVMGKASMLNLQKFAELRAPGWVCDPSLLKRQTGLECRTTMKEGVSRSLAWYRRETWL